MSKISQTIKEMAPKKKGASKTILLDFSNLTEAWRWVERQAAKHRCSKTAYIRALIELDHKTRGGE